MLPILFSLFACEKIDNYEAPDATLTGEVIDSFTGKALQTEQPQGFYIRYREVSDKYPDAQYRTFWGMADGKFNNSKLFPVTYDIFPYDGAFVQPEAQRITLSRSSVTTAKFSVTPYLAVTDGSINFDSSSKILTASFKIEKPADSPANPTKAFVALTWNPNVSYYCHGDSNGISGNLLSQNVDASVIGKTISFNIDCSNLVPGHTWYVRLGCISDKNNNRANYSEVYVFNY